MFTIVEEGYVVLKRKGVFKPSKVYLRHGHLYAAWAGGFIRLCKHLNGTSHPDITHEDLTVPFQVESDGLGRLSQAGALARPHK